MNKTESREQKNTALAYTWGKYRVYAMTSRKRKARLSSWRLYVLAFAVTGAFLATLSQQTSSLNLNDDWSWITAFLGAFSGIAIGAAVFFGKEIVNPDQESQWIRARSMAEALKSQAYRFITNVPPYSDKIKKEKLLLMETQELLEKVQDLPTESISDEQKGEKLPPECLNTEEYIRDRVSNQIEGYYRRQSMKISLKMKRIKTVGLGFGFVAIVLGALGFTGWTAGWVGAISTIMAAITAYAYANRYQYLIISYQATANRLESLRISWEISQKTVADRNQFILNCEEVISVENAAWMSELTKKSNRTDAQSYRTIDNK